MERNGGLFFTKIKIVGHAPLSADTVVVNLDSTDRLSSRR
jgi:hypothetical protein